MQRCAQNESVSFCNFLLLHWEFSPSVLPMFSRSFDRFFFSNFYPELKLSRNLGFMRKEHFCFIRWMNVTDLSFFKYFYVSSGLKGECFQARQMGVKRVLIVDWDVHAGQGTQYCIDDDENIRLISMHRYEYGKFWPQLPESAVKHSCQ